jgi:hypothetical protein
MVAARPDNVPEMSVAGETISPCTGESPLTPRFGCQLLAFSIKRTH